MEKPGHHHQEISVAVKNWFLLALKSSPFFFMNNHTPTLSLPKDMVFFQGGYLGKRQCTYISRGKNPSKSIFEISPPPLFVTNRGEGWTFWIEMCYFCPRDPKNVFWGLEDISMDEKFFFGKKKKMRKKLNFENTKHPEIFHFPFFFLFGEKKNFKNFNFHFTRGSWVFICFWRLYPQNFKN